MATIGLLHPGEMGAAVGGCLVSVRHTVLWDPDGRSRGSTGRAAAAGLTGVTLENLAARSSVILSICPPHAALDVARQVAATGFTGIYVDANAVAVATAEQVSGIVTAAGASYVDGGLIGQPPEAAGDTRLYLSGPRADEVRILFDQSALQARLADGPAYAASAVKMAYAAWTKGTSALLLAARALARAEGVEQTLLSEWALSQPALAHRSEGAAVAAAGKGWRWVAEMQEIAASMTAAGLPAGFHEAAADIYDRAAHAGSAPARTVPARTVPARTVPASTVPASTVPASTVPASTVPANRVPAGTAPADGVAVKPGQAGRASGAGRARSPESDFSSTLDSVIAALM